MDLLCQAKPGMGKTAVFVIATLQQIEPLNGATSVIVLCNTRELAFQVKNKYARFSKYLPEIRTEVFYGGTLMSKDVEILSDKTRCPHILVGTPGRVLALIRGKHLRLSTLNHFVLDECDKMLESLEMRRDVRDIFRATPHYKQVMMFSATLAKKMRPLCKRFMQTPLEIYVDDGAKLTLYGLQQYYIELDELQKNRKLSVLLDNLEFNQICIFVRTVDRANELNRLLIDFSFPSICIHPQMTQDERIKRYQSFKNFEKRIMVATDIFGRGIDIEHVNMVINYDMPEGADSYLHRVGCAGRFGTKGLSISFVSDEMDAEVLNIVQGRFEINIEPLPDEISLDT